jgi:hypothetical protein
MQINCAASLVPSVYLLTKFHQNKYFSIAFKSFQGGLKFYTCFKFTTTYTACQLYIFPWLIFRVADCKLHFSAKMNVHNDTVAQ